VFPEAKKIIHPLCEDYAKHRDGHDFEKAIAHLDPNAVIVHIGKKATYGKDVLKKELEEYAAKMGKVTTKVTNDHYQMSEDFIICKGDYEMTTEKAGTHKGKFTQIWRKHGDTYLLLLEEYTME
ncbi:hypothetical protein OESDEN_16676, partial [Oesophagostomum dentatum]